MTKKKTNAQEDLPTQQDPSSTSTALTDQGSKPQPPRSVKTVREWVHSPSFLTEIGDCIPKSSGVTNKRFKRLLWTSIQKTPKLLKCTIESVASCAYDMSGLDLIPGSLYGEAHLIPFKDTCTLILGYKGLMKLVIRSKAVERFESHLVYSCDKFKCTLGTDPVLEHEPEWNDPKRLPDNIVGAYSVAILPDGERIFVYMTRKELDKIGNSAIAKSNGRPTPWKTNYEEMLKKTVSRRHCKNFPMPDELIGAINQDAENERTGHVVVDPDAIDVEAQEVAPTSIEDVTQQVDDGMCGMCNEKEAGPNGFCSGCQESIDNQ